MLFSSVHAQVESNLRVKSVTLISDSLKVDAQSLVPGTIELRDESLTLIDTSLYDVRYFNSMLILNPEGKKQLFGQSVKVYYRTYPFDLSREYKHKDITLLESDQTEVANPFIYTVSSQNEDFFELEGLNKSGSISRGVSVGNNQDLAVNSNFNDFL